MDTRPADAVDVNWEVGKKYVVGQRDSTWLLHEMGICLEGLSSTVRQNLVYGDPRCASRVIVWSAFSLYTGGVRNKWIKEFIKRNLITILIPKHCWDQLLY